MQPHACSWDRACRRPSKTRSLGEAGFTVALDDLSSGFSTLAVVDALRPEIIKLDRALITGAHCDPYRARLTRALVDLARDLGIMLIAEGIESPEDLSYVRNAGIRWGQGYLLGRPEVHDGALPAAG